MQSFVYHLNSECRMQCFVDTMQNADRRIDIVLYQQSQELKIRNRGYISQLSSALNLLHGRVLPYETTS